MTTPLPATTRPLTPRQARFVDEYTADHNASAAARRAGYAPRSAGYTGHRLLKNAQVRAAIDQREAEIADRLGLTAEYALDRLRHVIEVALTPTPKTYQGGIVKSSCDDGCDGCPHVVMEVDGGVAHAAIRTLMQHRGMLTERSRVELASVLYEVVGVDVSALR
jgi:hypothetical protein